MQKREKPVGNDKPAGFFAKTHQIYSPAENYKLIKGGKNEI